jgi:hypothetical protein
MTTPTSPRWPSVCTGCGYDAEIESRLSHGMRALCDKCAALTITTATDAPARPRESDEASGCHPGEIPAADQLAGLFGLLSVGVTILGADIYGSGSRAAVEIRLSNGEVMTFDQLREMANAGILAAELVACTGATPKLAKPSALRAIALVRTIARQHRTMSDNDVAIEWGVTYLQAVDVLDMDLGNQADRWAAFSALAEIEPTREPSGVPPPHMVLRHIDGTRLVRSSWFVTHVKNMDSASARDIPTRMSRVGWHRRGSEGRVKATRPGLKGQLNWAFFFVPEGWENRAGGYEVTASGLVNARAQTPPLSRVEAVTGRNPVTASGAAA